MESARCFRGAGCREVPLGSIFPKRAGDSKILWGSKALTKNIQSYNFAAFAYRQGLE
jgi:hypothetical protein